MKVVRTAVLITLAALLVGCCACRRYQKRYGVPLTGTEWQLVQLDGRDVHPTEQRYTLRLGADGSVSGMGDCNRLLGRYQTDSVSALSFEGMGSTRMMCPDQSAEDAFLSMLSGTTGYKMDGAMLMLFRDGELHAVMEAREVPAPEKR